MKYQVLYLLSAILLCCSMPSKAWSASPSLKLTKTALTQLEQKALLGDQGSARELWWYYSFGKGQFDPDSEKKLNYWLQIAAENGGAFNYNSFSNLLQNYFALPTDENQIKNNLRSLYWAKQASLHSDSAHISWAVNFDLYTIFPIRTNYWQGVEGYFVNNQQVADEAAHLATGGPYLIPLDAAAPINKNTLPILVVNALLGNAPAAGRVANFFQTVKGANDLYWRTIAAEDGNIANQFWLAKHLSESADRDDRIRAAFWATKVTEQSKNEVLAAQAKRILLTAGIKNSKP